MPSPTSQHITAVQKKILRAYRERGRDLPWRKRVTPYRVLVSEIMLQQTQVERVIEKYKEFLKAFPSFSSLARAETSRLLAVWSGMGYNRRALALRNLAQIVVAEHKGRLPADREALLGLPGIGAYTAGAVLAFAFNQPVVFLDTNIRRVFIHEFFPGRSSVHDDELVPVIERCLYRKAPSLWYNALMDYGAALKKETENPNRRSVHYTRQSPFENSNRQVRGAILKALVKESPLSAARIISSTGLDPVRVRTNLERLRQEGFIKKLGTRFSV